MNQDSYGLTKIKLVRDILIFLTFDKPHVYKQIERESSGTFAANHMTPCSHFSLSNADCYANKLVPRKCKNLVWEVENYWEVVQSIFEVSKALILHPNSQISRANESHAEISKETTNIFSPIIMVIGKTNYLEQEPKKNIIHFQNKRYWQSTEATNSDINHSKQLKKNLLHTKIW